MEQEFDSSRVLIASADTSLRHQVYRRLLDRNIFSDMAADVTFALQHLGTTVYGVVLLDLSLGLADRIVELIGALPQRRRPVVLVLASPADAHSLDVEVVQVVLRKPVNLHHLAEIVSSCIRVAGEAPSASSPKSAGSNEESAA